MKFETIKQDYATFEDFKEDFETLTEYSKIDIWNQFCYANFYYDDTIFEMHELDNFIDHNDSICDILKKFDFQDFDPFDIFFKYSVFGFQSTSDSEDWIDIDEIWKNA